MAPFGPKRLLSRSGPGGSPGGPERQRRTAQPLTRLAGGGYSGAVVARAGEEPPDAGQACRVRRVLALAHVLACPGPVVSERSAERLGGVSGPFLADRYCTGNTR